MTIDLIVSKAVKVIVKYFISFGIRVQADLVGRNISVFVSVWLVVQTWHSLFLRFTRQMLTQCVQA